MIEFILFSRKGKTTGNFSSLRDGGRLDLVYQCLILGFFISGAIRRDVKFHIILGGPPEPPIHLIFDGRYLRDVRTDPDFWKQLFKKLLNGGSHPGVDIKKESFQKVLKDRKNKQIFVLEEKGENIARTEFGENPIFVIGDHVGLPRKEESFALRYGKKISLGKKPYLAASCIDIINYLLDFRTSR